MRIAFRIISGARAGTTEQPAKSYIAVGRHPLSDLRFDPERDLDVSTRHAAVIERGGEYVVRDLDSKNGTFVNGVRVASDQVLRDGDVLRFGIEGPTVECRIDRQQSTASEQPPPPVASARAAARSGATTRIKVEVARQTHKLRLTTGLLTVLLVVVLMAGVSITGLERRARQAELAALTARADSVQREAQATIAALEFEVRGLADAFREAEAEARRLKTELQSASAADKAEVHRLRAELATAETRQQAMLAAANLDYRAIVRANRQAVALIIVEFSPQERVAGTAFAVREDRVLATARHVVTGPDGTQRPTRIAVKFTDSNQWFSADVAALSTDADLALVRARFRGNVHTVVATSPPAPAPAVGDPVAVIGFPLGLDLPMEGRGLDAYAAPTLTLGTVTKTLSSLTQIDGYGAEGASGSPVFDAAGHLLGVVTGGQAGTGGRIVFADPARAVAALLSQLEP